MKFFVKTKLSENISKTQEGYLLCRNVALSHTGPLQYGPTEHPFGADKGIITIRRKPEELFSEATIASFQGKPVTIKHPSTFVAPENYKQFNNGSMINVRKLEDKVQVDGEEHEVLGADFLIMSDEAIKAVEDGLREVSLGYDAVWVLEDGEDEGEHTKIRGNHCALVDEGRAGINCKIIDHKGEDMTLEEMKKKYKKFFGKSLDEAMKEKEDEAKKAKDAEEEKAKKDKESKDEGEAEKAASLEERIGLIEKSVAQIIEKLSSEEEAVDESDLVTDEDEEEVEVEDEEACDEDKEKEKKDKKDDKAQDNSLLSQAEILVPGMKQSKTIVKDTLEKFAKTTDGKAILDRFTGGKEISKLNSHTQKAFFHACAEIVKNKRATDSKIVQPAHARDQMQSFKADMTPEKMNEINKQYYNKK